MTNVLVIHADDMRYDHLPYMPTVRTRIPYEFTNHRVNTPLCGPERAGLLTGQWAKDHGCYVASGAGPDITTTGPGILPTWLSDESVATAVFGKYIQTIDADRSDPWDTARMLEASNLFDNYDYGIWNGTASSNPGLVQPGVHVEDYFADQIDTWLQTVTEPWFCWWTPPSPHVEGASPFQCRAHPDDIAAWSWLQWDITEEPDCSDKPSWLQSGDAHTAAELQGMRRSIRRQVRELNALDRAIGTVLDRLATENMTDDTLVFFTSDNGVHYGEHGYTTTFTSIKNVCYDFAVRVPLMATGPGIPSSGSSSVQTTGQDLTATAVAVASATPTLSDQVGIDLRDAISNPASYADRELLLEVEGTSSPYPTAGTADAIVKTYSGALYKLIEWNGETGTDQYELYDLDTDPDEHANLANDGDYSATVTALAADLSTLRS